MTAVGAAMDVRFGAAFEEFVAHVTDIGLSHVELKTEYLQGHPNAPSPETVRAVADDYGVTITYHAPFRDWNMGSFNDEVRRASVSQVKSALDAAATAGAGAVVVHGGGVPERYPRWVREASAAAARQSLAECAEYAQFVGVPLCLENQPAKEGVQRYTTTPADLAGLIEDVNVLPGYLGVTLDVGHAKANGLAYRDFVERFGDRIRVCHLHDNDGTGDHHEPLDDYERFVDAVPADYFVFEMKSVADVARCINADVEPVDWTPDAVE